jgi:hypothetical protein
MLKLLDILEEGTLQLTPDERNQVEEILPDIIDTISGRYIGDNMAQTVGIIKYLSADKTPSEVKIQVGNNLSQKNANGYYQTNDPKNPTDNIILLQQFHFQPYFNKIGKLYSTATGDKNPGIEAVRRVLKHELIHAKDPSVNQHYLKEPYDSSDNSVYYKSWAEFQTMTGQFFEAITTGVDRALNSGMPKEKISRALDNILKTYAGKEVLTQDTADFIQDTGKRNIFQSLIKFAENIISNITGISVLGALDAYVLYLKNIKQYNPEGYKEFLTDLYKTIDQAKDKLNNLQEMKYINEAKRFQQLAGIITEVETEQSAAPVDDPEIDAAMKAGLSVLTTEAKFLDEIKDENQPQELNESVLALIGSGLLAAPKIIEWIGKAIAFISKPFMKNKDENAIAEKIVHFAHKWEKLYIKAIIWGIKKTKFVQQIWMTPDGNIDEQKLVVVAKYLYAGVLALAMGQAIGAVLGPSSAIIKAIEGSLGTVKAVEIAQIASKIKGQL